MYGGEKPEEACSGSATLFWVGLTFSQILDLSRDLSTQRTTDFLADFNEVA